MELKDQTAVVTGASRGIGQAIAVELARAGAKVVLGARSTEALAGTLQQIPEGMGIAYAGDLSETAACEGILAAAGGRVDILVNNAGITRDGLLIRMKDSDWDEVLQTNLRSAFVTCRAASKLMLRQKSGRIINITSVIGVMGNAGQANYAASKAGLIGFTKSVARELASRGICVNAVAPGYIETDMTSDLPAAVKEQILKNIPLGSLGRPEDVAGLVRFLAGPQSRYITGQVFHVDGGMVM